MAEEIKNLNKIILGTDAQNTVDEVEKLPQPVKDWLVSLALAYIVMDLNRRLGLENNLDKFGVIPDLLLDVATKKTTPNEMINKISQYLDIDPVKATSIAKEIKEKMLRPIEATLRRELGVDINMIDFAQPTAAPAPKPAAPVAPVFQMPRPTSPPPSALPGGGGPPVPPVPPAPKPVQPVETKIPINVIKEGDGKDSWLNKLK